jgi:hypothetical protein
VAEESRGDAGLALLQDTERSLLEADLALVRIGMGADEPYLIEHLTTDLLTDILANETPGAEVLSAERVGGSQGMTDRAVLHLEWNEVGQAADRPSSLFAKATPHGGGNEHLMYLSVLHMGELEARFFTELSAELPDIAPHHYYARSSAGGRFLIAMEDLTVRGARMYSPGDDGEIGHARGIVKALARLHARYWETPRFSTDLAWIRPQLHRYGSAWMREAFHQARVGLPKHPNYPNLPDSVQQMTALFDVNDLRVYEYWATLPATVVHGDAHLGNTYGTAGETGGLVDWQSLFRVHGVRDLAYFMAPALPVALRRTHEESLIDLYVSTLADGGVALDRDVARDLYRFFLLEAWDAHVLTIVVGTFGHRTAETERRVVAALTDNEVPELLQSFLATA